MRVLEQYRIRSGPMASDASYGNNGAFRVPLAHGQFVNVIVSEEYGWQHVSVSRVDRPPTWGEMCEVKALFFDDEETVVQYHPARSVYVNFHPNCLHMWRPLGEPLPTPPTWMIGPRLG